MTLRRSAIAILVASTVAACRTAETPTIEQPPAPVGEPAPLPSPAGGGANTPFLALTPDGALLAGWTERDTSGRAAIRVARYAGSSWDTPRTITAGGSYFVNWADTPSLIALGNGDLVAHWLAREGSGTYAYGIRMARSQDRGETWSEPVTPHDDGLLAEHGFVSLWDAGDGQVGAVWLDGRKTAMPDSAKEMTVRTATYDRAMTRANDAVLDARSCDCCPTAVALAADGPVAVWRDRSDEEIRDIVVSRHADGAWQPPVKVHADEWRIDGCPVNGPAIVAAGDTVTVAWFTGARDTAKVQIATSTDGGRTFATPTRLDDGEPVGRVAMTADGQGAVIVAWVERADGGATLRARRVDMRGRASAPTTLMQGDAARASGVPHLARLGDTLVAVWTDVAPAADSSRSSAAAVSRLRLAFVQASLR